MLAICDKYASDFDMAFNANKSKCLVVLPPSRLIDGRKMEIVSSYSHLSHIISSSVCDRLDIMSRNATLMVKLTICSVC